MVPSISESLYFDRDCLPLIDYWSIFEKTNIAYLYNQLVEEVISNQRYDLLKIFDM